MSSAGLPDLPQLKARLFDRKEEFTDSLQDLLPPRLQARLKNIASELEFPRGECDLFCEGEDAHFVYLVETGTIRISRLSPAERRQVLAFVFSGGIFGIPDEGRYVNSAQAIGPARLYRFAWASFSGLMQEEPDMKSALLARIAFDFRQAQRRIAVLSQQNACQKLASFLLDLRQYPEFRDKRKGHVRLSLSRSDLGDYLGVTPETLARVLARMEALGVLRRKECHLVQIRDMEILQQIARGPRRALPQSESSRTPFARPN